MLKQIALVVTSLCCAICLRAQTEPQKPAAEPASSRPPTLHDATNTPAEQSPPPAVISSPESGTRAAAKPRVEKSPPPLDRKNMDVSTKPQDDFYSFANGGWLKRNPIPPEYSRWGSFNELIEKNNDALHEIAEKAAAAAPKETTKSKVEKVGDYYGSGM